MTFDIWYAANIEPTLPRDAPPVIRKAARESMAACWNAAIDKAQETVNFDKNERAPYDLSPLKVKP